MRALEEYVTKSLSAKGVTEFIDDGYHDNFGLQWNEFDKLQLDSFNGSNETSDRLLFQSELAPEYFNGKTVLEVGAGNGRFTEILLSYGARVVAVDYSSAIFANFDNHAEFVEKGKLICLRADVFDLPILKSAFDIVLCYGVIQHTGNNQACLQALAQHVKSDGLLLVDIYSNSLKHFNPFIYAIRPFFGRIKRADKKLSIVRRFVEFIFPTQLRILSYLHKKKSIFRFFRYLVNRSPNSVYGINLYLDKKISLENAKKWSVCDTHDAWMPKHDHPVSFKKWKSYLKELRELDLIVCKESGQGNCAVLVRNESN